MRTNISDNEMAFEVPDDQALVSMAKLGDQAAFSELWSRHSKRTFRTLMQITRQQQDAEDAFQDTFLKVYLHLESFDGCSKFSTWLTRVATNSALMILRKRKRYPILIPDADRAYAETIKWNIADRAPSAEASVLRAERLVSLALAIKRLPPHLREVIDVQLKEDLSNKHLADSVGLSIPAAKSRLLRARGVLRKKLQRTYSSNGLFS